MTVYTETDVTDVGWITNHTYDIVLTTTNTQFYAIAGYASRLVLSLLHLRGDIPLHPPSIPSTTAPTVITTCVNHSRRHGMY